MLLRTQIDLFECKPASLRAVTSLWQLAQDIIKDEQLPILGSVQTCTSDDSRQHMVYSLLQFGYLHISTIPEDMFALCDICRRSEPWPVENVLKRLQHTFSPGRVKVFHYKPGDHE